MRHASSYQTTGWPVDAVGPSRPRIVDPTPLRQRIRRFIHQADGSARRSILPRADTF